MSTIRFNLRRDKINTDGKAPVEMIYQIHGQRKYYGTGFLIYPVYWSQDLQKAIVQDPKKVKKESPGIERALYLTSKEIQEFNSDLNELTAMVKRIENRFVLDNVQYTCTMVLDRLKAERLMEGVKESPQDLFFSYMDEFITTKKAMMAQGSLSAYKALKAHLLEFQRMTGKRVTFEAVDYHFFEKFQSFLVTNQSLLNTTVAKQLSTLKTLLNNALKQKKRFNISMEYKDFVIRRKPLDVIALTGEEFLKLYKMDLSQNKRLCQVRDVFCFSCVTGLRYSDLAQLSREHIKSDCINITIQKTRENLIIPLTPYSKEILNRYKNFLTPLPIISNQKMNEYLKELCEKAEISEPIEVVKYKGAEKITKVQPKFQLIGVHTGRKTFATLSLERGMSTEEVMSITGHKDYKSFKRYVKVTEQRKKVVMVAAWKAEKKSKLKAV